MVRGWSQWSQRLTAYREAEAKRTDGDGNRPAWLDQRLAEIDGLRAFVADLVRWIAARPERGTWGEQLAHLTDLFNRYLDEHEPITGALASLAQLDGLTGTISADRFDRTVRSVIEGLSAEDAQAGRAGAFRARGINVVDVNSLRHMRFRAVCIVGLAEREFPPAPKQDPLLLDAERAELNEQFGWELPLRTAGVDPEPLQFALAVSAARERLQLSYARTQHGSARPLYASGFLRSAVAALTGRRIAAEDLDELGDPWFVRLPGGRIGATELDDALDAFDYDRTLVEQAPTEAVPVLASHRPAVARGRTAWLSRRFEPVLTPYDGGLSPAAEAVLESHPRLSGALSASAFQGFAECGLQFFLSRVLGLRALEEPEDVPRISALDRGDLVHRILELVLSELLPGDPPRHERRDAHLALVERIADEQFAAFQAHGLTGHPQLWEIDKSVMLAELRLWYDAEILDAETRGSDHAAFEVSYGLPLDDDAHPLSRADPAEIAVGRRTLRLSGRIDRLQWRGRGDGFIVIDYKTGRQRDKKRALFDGGSALQLPLYLHGAGHLLGRSPHAGTAEYFYVSRRGGFARHVMTGDALASATAEFDQVLGSFADAMFGGVVPRATRRAKVHVLRLQGALSTLGGARRPHGYQARRSSAPWRSSRVGDQVSALIDAGARERIENDLDVSMCVEAGAGTGKTTMLVRRIVALLRTGRATIEQLAVITFTEKAAAELSARLRFALEVAADDAVDEHERVRLETALLGLYRARVQTIHAFAGDLLRERPVEAGIDPQFGVLEELASSLDFDAVYRAWLDDLLASSREEVEVAMRRGFELRHLRQVAEIVHQHRDVLPLAPLTPAAPDVAGYRAWAAGARQVLEECEPTCVDHNDNAYPWLAQVVDFLTLVQQADAAELERLVLFEAPWPGLGGAKGNWSPAENCGRVKDIYREVRDRTPALRDALRTDALVRVLPHVERFVQDYTEQRRLDGVADFDDLLIRARDLVRDNRLVRDHFHRRTTHVLVDEFQDTDPIQAELVSWITAPPGASGDWRTVVPQPGRLFVVGDPKQSIYRFRGADIAAYDTVKNGPLAGRLERLEQNFRSTRSVLTWINDVFDNVFTAQPGVQPGNSHLHARATSLDDELERSSIVVVHSLGDWAATDDSAEAMRKEESSLLARTLWCAVARERWPVRDRRADDAVRPAQWRDIAVLLPARTRVELLEAALQDHGVPYRLEGGRGFYSRQEVRDLISLLEAIDDPGDAIAIVAALRSLAFGCSDEELLLWRTTNSRFDYRRPGTDGPASVRESLEVIGELHRAQRSLSLGELVRRAVDEAGLVEAALDGPRGRPSRSEHPQGRRHRSGVRRRRRRRPAGLHELARAQPRRGGARGRRASGRGARRRGASHDRPRGQGPRVPHRRAGQRRVARVEPGAAGGRPGNPPRALHGRQRVGSLLDARLGDPQGVREGGARGRKGTAALRRDDPSS